MFSSLHFLVKTEGKGGV